mmetsp:Transcript_15854/g.47653  ORF Transcript_15854/g.47653 Transcript_15854/m.47653 type:complete len:225 (-) Transcript_15854:204-878(-)
MSEIEPPQVPSGRQPSATLWRGTRASPPVPAWRLGVGHARRGPTPCAAVGQISVLPVGPRSPSDGHEVDAVAVAQRVGEVVAQMRAVERDHLAAGQAAHQVPVRLRIAEAQPAVDVRVLHKVLEGAPPGDEEQRLARVAVVEGALPKLEVGRLSSLRLLVQEGGRLEIAEGLGLPAIEVADPVGKLPAATPAKVLPHSLRRCPMSLGPHNPLVAHHARRQEGVS